jgi:hypothetical protein
MFFTLFVVTWFVHVLKAIELSEEERSMNGAPEGELFVAKILKREEVCACSMTYITQRKN